MSQLPRDLHTVTKGIQRFGSPWKLTVLAYLLERPMRSSEILRVGEGDGLNSRTLSRALKGLADQGLVNRSVIGTHPVAVRYSVTEKGTGLGRLLAGFADANANPDLRDVGL